MRILLKPFWLFVTVTLPQIFIFCTFLWIFRIIGSQLNKENMATWWGLGIFLGLLSVAFTLYGIVSTVFVRRNIHPTAGIGLLVTYTPFLYLFFTCYNSVVPSNIPNWMLFGIDPQILVLTLIMPTLTYGMFVTVGWLTPKDKKINVGTDVALAIGIPLFWYMAFTVAAPLISNWSSGVVEHAVMILFVLSTVCFFFFLIRMIYVLLQKKPVIWQKAAIIIGLVCPILGLILNNSRFSIFGDFSHPCFYILAVVNGLLMIIPPLDHKLLRTALFAAKSITFAYTAYFFLVFLPYLPVSIIAVLFIGLGILMLTPLVLALVHVKSLWTDYEYLAQHYRKFVILLIFIAGLAVLPASIVLTINRDREDLDKALKFVYQRSLEDDSTVKLNIAGIKRTLDNIKSNKTDDRGFIRTSENKVPYITSFYNWFVLDNLTLSEDKIKKMKQIFTGEVAETFIGSQPVQNANIDIKIKDYRVETTFDPINGFNRSWIHLDLQSQFSGRGQYSTVFDLPSGSYISNYYLYIGNEKNYGLIADKRAANWVYQQIVRVQRDPGILSYVSGHRVAFRVFPFETGEVRKTGIEIIHRGTVNLNIDGNEIVLKDVGMDQDRGRYAEYQNVVYLSAEAKRSLPKMKREPEYYFIVDFSKGNENKIKDYFSSIKRYAEKNGIDASNGNVVAANFNEIREKFGGDWESKLGASKVQGGFFADRAVKKILYDHYKTRSKTYPVMIMVTDDVKKAVLSDDYQAMEFTYPESEYFYHLGRDNSLDRYSLKRGVNDEPVNMDGGLSRPEVLAWPDISNPVAFLPDNGRDSIVIKNDSLSLDPLDFSRQTWENALMLEAENMNLFLHPDRSADRSLDIVKNSIKSRIMTPLTSFIVLENEAQKNAMLEKQKQILSTKKALDAGDQNTMSEPPLWILALFVTLFVVFVRYRNRVLKKIGCIFKNRKFS